MNQPMVSTLLNFKDSFEMKKIALLFLITLVSMLLSLSSTAFAFASKALDQGSVLVLSDDVQKDDDEDEDDEDDHEKHE